MIVTAALSYYDDDLELLDLCLRSLPVVADTLTVVDGRYERYEPGGPASSPKTHVAFIKNTCRDIGIPVTVETTGRPWRGQVEKRSRLLQLASENSDWIVGVDADHVLHGVREAVRGELETLDADAVDVQYWTTVNPDRPLSESAAGEWHASLAGDWAWITGLFRSLPGLRVERKHWWYSAVKGNRRHWIWGGDNTYPHGKTHQLRAPYFVEHRCLFRQTRHILANRLFCEDRVQLVELTGNEDP